MSVPLMKRAAAGECGSAGAAEPGGEQAGQGRICGSSRLALGSRIMARPHRAVETRMSPLIDRQLTVSSAPLLTSAAARSLRTSPVIEDRSR
jgi:hypothetical protein